MSETSVLRTYVLGFFFAFSIFVNQSIAMILLSAWFLWDMIQLQPFGRLEKKSEDLKNTHLMKNYTKIMKQIIQELFLCFPQPTQPSLNYT